MLDRDEVLKIAHLARIQLADSEVPRYAGELSRILDMVEQMGAVDTSGIQPMAHPVDAVQRLRPDTVTESDRREELQRGAPATENGCYLVPRVLD